jgi:hypothetical protein
LTDLPLVPDKPIDFGCRSTAPNVRYAPNSARCTPYPTGKETYNGYETYGTTSSCAYRLMTNPSQLLPALHQNLPMEPPGQQAGDFKNWTGISNIYTTRERQARRMRENNSSSRPN